MEKIWLKNYPDGVPHDIQLNHSSLLDLLEKSCLKFKDKVAFVNMGKSITYKELDQMTRAFAAYIQNHTSLKKGDRIALQMPNLLQYPVALFGALRAGLVVVNVNPLYTPREMKFHFKDSGAKAIVILTNFASNLQEVLADTEIETVITTDLGDMLGFPKRVLVNAVIKHVKKMIPNFSLPKAVPFNEVLSKGFSTSWTRTSADLEDIAFLQYTGGTTGVAKGAILTHKNILSNSCQILEWMKPNLNEGEETVVTPLPLYHIFSLTANLFVFLAYGGTNILITNPKDIAGFIKTLKQHSFTVMTGVNTLFNALLNHPDFASINFKPLKCVVAGGAALHTSVAEKWKQVTKAPIAEGFGLTETSPVACCNPLDGSDQVGTIGLPLPSTNIKIVDDNGEELPLGEDGELCIHGPQVMRGYWNKDEETAAIMLPGGWLKTGDIARADESGFFKIVDRKKDMILVSGFNVFPNEVENVVSLMDGILEAAVVGVPDNKSGEAVKLFVVPKGDSFDEQAIRDHCKKNLTSYKIPKYIEHRDELPKTNVGKILRRALKNA